MVQWLGDGFTCGCSRFNFGLVLFPVVPDSTLSRFVNSQLVASCHLGFSIMFFQVIKSGMPVN